MTRFRLSSHSLEIKRGRYNQTPPEKRFCTYCTDIIGREIFQNEEHFILHCPLYEEVRKNLLPCLSALKIHLTDEQKLIHILSNKRDLSETAKYIFLASEHRKTTLDVLKFIQNLTTEIENLVKNGKTQSYKISEVSNTGLKILLMK